MTKRRFSIGLCAAIVLYVALRALLLLTNFEEVVMPMFELFPMGTMAETKLRGVHYPLRFYYDNAAGQLVMGHAAIPLYWLFGSSYFVLKLLPVMLGVGALVILWCLLDRHFSRLAANIGALLFALSPSTLFRYSVACSGNHFENLVFTLLFLWCFYRHHGVMRSRWSLFWAAFSGGFALFVFLGALIPVGICAGMHLGLRGLRRTLVDAPVALLGFVLGIAPLVVINAATSGRGLGFLSAKFGEGRPRPPGVTTWTRIEDFLGDGLLEAGMFEPGYGISGPQWSIVFVVVFSIAWFLSLPAVARGIGGLLAGTFRKGAPPGNEDAAFERVKLVPFVLYVPLTALAFGIANFELRNYQHPMIAGGYRYYLPTLLFALILIAIWSARLWERRGIRRAGGVMLAAAAFLACSTNVRLIDWSGASFANGLRYDGYNFAHLSRNLVTSRNNVSRAEMVMRVHAWPKEVRDPVIRGLGSNLCISELIRVGARDKVDWTLDLDTVLQDFPEEWHPLLANGAGTGMRNFLQGGAQTGRLPEFLRHVRPADGPLAEEAVAGSAAPVPFLPFGREVFDVFTDNLSLLTMDTPHREAFARGHGFFCGRLKARGVPREVAFVDEFAARFDSEGFREGLAAGVAYEH